jgi:uncharacterized protein (TIGR00297 family)
MSEEMQGVEGDTGWRKAIPEGRDRLQSRVLVGVVGALLVWMSEWTLHRYYVPFATDPEFVITVIGISAGFAALVLILRAATVTGAIFGGMICLILVNGTLRSECSIIRSGLMPLVLLFVLTYFATRAGRRRKAGAGLAEGRKGRSAAQVIANLSIAALSVSILGLGVEVGGFGAFMGSSFIIPMKLMCLAALVEATADTVSSEIGQAFGGKPVMLLNLKRVEPGTDGAITLFGSAAGIAAGAMVTVAGIWGLQLKVGDAAIALGAGICGLFFDSLLGATVERRGWAGNDLVNFASTVFAAALARNVYHWIYRIYY